ncbi:hypothetical protein GCM10022393_04840 [Aquimarina addita]|uniref:OmpA-like domain-containing protein n=1 Tax=Aquimarina addita TaxID=870485 RepID=A0ABP7X9U0_9FLAO
MTKKSTYLFGIVLTIIIGAILNWYLCCNPGIIIDDTKKIVEDKVVPPVQEAEVINPLSIKDDTGTFDYTTNDNINFDVSSNAIRTPIATTVDTGILKLTKYLSTNPNKTIDITGYYMNSENYNGALPNLGIARATAVKNYLMEKGISSKQINVLGSIDTELTSKDNILLGPISFNINTKKEEDTAKADDELKELRKKIIADPLVLYFDTGDSNIQLTAAQKQKVSDISTYLDKVDGAKCMVVGHTDSRGQLAKNISLGQERADATKAYLVRNDILESKIEAISKGPKEPIASNKTKDGQAKNRRTVITLN